MTAEPQSPDVGGTVFETGAVEIARSYAHALLNLIEESAKGEESLAELDEFVAEIWHRQPDFATLLGGGFLHQDRRDQLIGEMLEGRADDLLIRFLRVVNRRDRLSLLPQIVGEARKLWDRRHQVVEVSVRSAVELDDAQREAILKRLKSLRPDQTARLTTHVDPSILGGLVIQVGDQMFDDSVRIKLHKVRQQMLAARFREIKGRRDELAQGAVHA